MQPSPHIHVHVHYPAEGKPAPKRQGDHVLRQTHEATLKLLAAADAEVRRLTEGCSSHTMRIKQLMDDLAKARAELREEQVAITHRLNTTVVAHETELRNLTGLLAEARIQLADDPTSVKLLRGERDAALREVARLGVELDDLHADLDRTRANLGSNPSC